MQKQERLSSDSTVFHCPHKIVHGTGRMLPASVSRRKIGGGVWLVWLVHLLHVMFAGCVCPFSKIQLSQCCALPPCKKCSKNVTRPDFSTLDLFASFLQLLPSTFVLWVLYSVVIAVVFTVVKLVNQRLHHMYDTSEVVEDEEEEQSTDEPDKVEETSKTSETGTSKNPTQG